MENVRWPAEQLEEHRLEISNRIRNLFWTVSGDYDMEFEPDTEKYVYSKQTVVYEAVKQGAFARYFDQKKLGMYLMKKLHFSADLKADTTFEELKMDDYEIVDFLMNVEECYRFAFHENEMLEMKTMQNVMDMINKNMQED